MADISRAGDIDVRIVDATSQYTAKVDAYGSTQNRLFDAAGNLLVGQKTKSASIPVVLASDQTPVPVTFSEEGPPARTIINLQHDANFGNSRATTWESLITYVVPDDYAVSLVSFLAVNNSTACQNRLIGLKTLATYDVGTDVYANTFVATAPKFFSRLELQVTADSTGGNWTMTITYTNQDGVTGRTATVAVTNNYDTGHFYNVTLQTGDYGVRAVTGVARSTTGRTGTFNLLGVDEISFYDTEVAWRVNEKVYGRDSLVVDPDSYDALSIQRYADSTSNFYTRMIACFTIYEAS